ncbi:FAD-binding domain-containing protein [Fomitopsis serialis]|uniref:FAD-binding domain-containing protein n=1 Tax=Fomitopsis serialis TaxID=139415 RepID=UPI0020088CE6|nr:FAD-binding domain-containing protein [Neoantrodia serialis]KAH9929832.1 FAD-binding domain-containing protein [Neoantrodia serialis]
MRHILQSILFFTSTFSYTGVLGSDTGYSHLAVCNAVAQVVSSKSSIFYPGSDQYNSDNHHWALSSTTNSTCTVEPGTAEDIGKILTILGITQAPFGVKGAGHTGNPGFSSTVGVQIAMSRFNEVSYDADTGIAKIGAGNVWDNVYAGLQPFNVGVVGGRVSGIGVAGFTLGGGYSYKTNEYGLTIDTVDGFEVVLPSGAVVLADATHHPDLFYGLKGGYNNFGIVTAFYLKTHPETSVWGGSITTTGVDGDVMAAVLKFYSTVTDSKAALLPTFNYDSSIEMSITQLGLFYNAPEPPQGLFDDFMAIPALVQNVSTRSLLSLIQASPEPSGLRGSFHTTSLHTLSSAFLNAVVNETEFWSAKLTPSVPGLFLSYDAEPFLSSYLSHGSPSAWPPSRSTALLPIILYYAWALPENDTAIHEAMVQSVEYLTRVAIAEGQDVAAAPLYPNNVIDGVPMERMYGENLERLRAIKAVYDPADVMSLAGGWKF